MSVAQIVDLKEILIFLLALKSLNISALIVNVTHLIKRWMYFLDKYYYGK